jgi:predicted house-cleaning noncanonical NTP pyrophosphatase (MazG superfamily)
MMVEKIKKAYEFEAEVLEKHKEEIKEVAQNKMIREVVTESLNEVLEIDNIAQNKNELIETLLKKVA